uniref:stage III sporulation protein AE n=1 Tax=Agathobacter sp. TaxID=2021311 RepID=UPI00405685AC
MSSENTAAIEQYLEEMLGSIDFQGLNQFVNEHFRGKMTFEELVSLLAAEGGSAINPENITTLFFDSLFYEISAARPIFLKMLCFGILFSIVQKLISTKNRYISDVGFLLIYSTITALLMHSFSLVKEMAMSGLDSLLQFLNVLIPTYAASLVFSGNAITGGIFYEIAFMVIYLMELLMKNILSPLIHVFVLVVFLNNLFEEDRLSKLAELMEKAVQIFLKASFGIVAGLSVIQSVLAPAKDRLADNVVLQGLSALPGVGNAFGSAGEIILSCGILVKNSIGVAALILLVLLAVTPVLKLGIFWLLYHVLSSVMQPIADSRITECVSGVARGCDLYMKMLINSMLLFFIMFSVISAATTFVY